MNEFQRMCLFCLQILINSFGMYINILLIQRKWQHMSSKDFINVGKTSVMAQQMKIITDTYS